ncbi:hypothetical protein JCM19992_30920 [Thermostilla marina]
MMFGVFELIIIAGVCLVPAAIVTAVMIALLSRQSREWRNGLHVFFWTVVALLIVGLPVVVGSLFLWTMRSASLLPPGIVAPTDAFDRSRELEIEPQMPPKVIPLQETVDVEPESTTTSESAAREAGEQAAEPEAVEHGDDAPTSTEDESGASDAVSARPQWVGGEPKMVDGVYQWPISVGPYLSEGECRARLRDEVEHAITRYVAECEGEAVAVRLPWSYVEEHLLADTYLETREVNISSTDRQPVVILHALLRFDHQANATIRDAALRVKYTNRALTAAAGLGGLLWLLSLVWAYLRIDIATKGRYRGRLRLALAAVMAVPVIAAALVIA